MSSLSLRGYMNYEIAVFEIDWFDEAGDIYFKNYVPLGLIRVKTETEVEAELLYILANTSNSSNVLWNMLKNKDNKNYMLVCAKQSRYSGLYKYFGYSIISKRHDAIFWDTKYMNLGTLNAYNVKTRDPIEEVRRGHLRNTPGAETPEQMIKQGRVKKISLEQFRRIQEENRGQINPANST